MSQYTPPILPMSPMPPGHAAFNPPQRGNGPAVASLVLGLLGCVPVLTGLLAIVLGAVGLRKARDPAVGGKGLAIAGLILGILSIIGWAVFGSIAGYAYVQTRPARIAAEQFLQEVSAGNVAAAQADSIGLSASELRAGHNQIAGFGALRSVNVTSFETSQLLGNLMVRLKGFANFDNGQKTCSFNLIKTGETYKVTEFTVE